MEFSWILHFVYPITQQKDNGSFFLHKMIQN